MGLLEVFSLCLPNEHITDAARQIAARCQPELSQRVCGRFAGMSAAEKRGYIRARSANVVQREVDLALQWDRRLRAADRPTLLQMTTDAVLAAVAAESGTRRKKQVA
jgi:hypothetical protein